MISPLNSSSKISTLQIGLLSSILFFVPLLFNLFANLTFELPKVVFFRSSVLIGIYLLFIQILRSGKIYVPKLAKHPYLLYLIISFFSITFVASIFSISPNLSFFGSYHRQQGFMTLLALYLLFFIILTTSSVYQKKNFLIISGISSATLIAFYGILQKFGLDPIKGWEDEAFLGRIFGTLGHPNFLGQLLIITILLNLGLLIVHKRKVLLSLAILIQILALIFTLSRASFLGLSFGLVFFSIIIAKLFSPKYFRVCLALILTGCGIFAAVNIFSQNQIINQNQLLKRFLLSGENLRSIESRLFIWPVALKAIKEHPFLGSGPETFALTFPKYQPKELLELEIFTETADRAHNEILDLTLNYGLIGSFLYYSIFFALFTISLKKVFQLDSREDQILLIASLAALISQIVANQFSFPSLIHQIYIWFLIAFIIKLIYREEHSYQIIPHANKSLKIISLIAVAFIFAFSAYYFNLKSLKADKAFKKAEGLFKSQNPFQSISEYQKALSFNPNQSYYYFFLSHASLQAAKRSQGVEQTKYLEISKDAAIKGNNFARNLDFNGYYLLGQAYSFESEIMPTTSKIEAQLKREKEQLVLNTLVKGIKNAPNNPRLNESYSFNLYKQGKFAESVKAFEKYLSLTPPYWKWNLSERTIEEQEKSRIFFKLNPNFSENFIYLSRSYAKIENFQKALEYLKYAPENNIDTLSTYAVIYSLLGQKKKAKEYLLKGLELDPENPILHQNLKILEPTAEK